jgi:peptidoglycan/LPS O-acetylase OafA/YrhL
LDYIFIKKRVYRIYPALIVGYIILGIYLEASAQELSQDMLLVTTIGNPVTWSLKVEVEMAFLLPLFFLLFRTKHKFLPIAIALFVFFLHKFNLDILFSAIPLPRLLMGQFLYFIRTSYYIFPFVVGMYGYEYYDELKKYCSNNFLFLFGALALCSAEFIISSDSYYAVFVQSFASLIVITGCNESSVVAWLSSKPLIWLGKISYSFYLYHPIALYVLIFTIFPRLGIQYPLDNLLLNIPFITIVGVGVAILLGWLSYQFVEQQFLMSNG